MQTITESPKLYLPFPIVVEENLGEQISPRTFRWTKDEYYKLSELGFFADKRTELIGGEIIEMPTMNSPHATSVRKVAAVLNRIFAQTHVVDVQLPINLSENSEAVPDVAIIAGQIDDFTEAHPQTAVLIVEVADTTLKSDKTKKVRLYAQNQISEYWIINVKHRVVEVYRRPVESGYEEVAVYTENKFISPLAAPETTIAVADLLPAKS